MTDLVHRSQGLTIPGELVARLEAASVGSRELDAAVHLAAFPEAAAKAIELTGGFWKELISESAGGGCVKRIVCADGHYTTYLDAALALASRVLPGWFAGMQQNRGSPDNERWSFWLEGPEREQFFEENGPTSALAACKAILKALAATSPAAQVGIGAADEGEGK